jgi:hypothetical protein
MDPVQMLKLGKPDVVRSQAPGEHSSLHSGPDCGKVARKLNKVVRINY